MAPDRTDRYATATDLAHDLAQLAHPTASAMRFSEQERRPLPWRASITSAGPGAPRDSRPIHPVLPQPVLAPPPGWESSIPALLPRGTDVQGGTTRRRSQGRARAPRFSATLGSGVGLFAGMAVAVLLVVWLSPGKSSGRGLPTAAGCPPTTPTALVTGLDQNSFPTHCDDSGMADGDVSCLPLGQTAEAATGDEPTRTAWTVPLAGSTPAEPVVVALLTPSAEQPRVRRRARPAMAQRSRPAAPAATRQTASTREGPALRLLSHQAAVAPIDTEYPVEAQPSATPAASAGQYERPPWRPVADPFKERPVRSRR
jgi:hypothetical protein